MSRGGYDELRFPDDEYGTITREQYVRNEQAREAAEDAGEVVERRRVEVVGYSGSRLA